MLPPTNTCFWEELLQDTPSDSLQFIAAMLEADASNWGKVTDFIILEEEGRPLAGAAGYSPYTEEVRPLNMAKIEAIAQILGWSTAETASFRTRYEQLWEGRSLEFLRPVAPWIIETVAVLPEARGRGLGKVLIKALLEEGRSRQYDCAGLMVINGNEIARRTYESLGFKPYQTFYADYFDNRFSGVTKFRFSLN
ncbi:MAG: GNAT family N-acetyltransferase [Cyanobacteria bacterium SBLK]|nr:GNAT family N-acetyltransferase [Cyanobacteria bacterium SBLK]